MHVIMISVFACCKYVELEVHQHQQRQAVPFYMKEPGLRGWWLLGEHVYMQIAPEMVLVGLDCGDTKAARARK